MSDLRKMKRALAAATGVEPAIEQVSPARWRLTLSNDVVLLTVDYESRLGKVKQVDSALFVDGKRVPNARNFDHFIEIWYDPDIALSKKRVPVPYPVPPDGDITKAPSVVRRVYETLVAGIVKAGAQRDEAAAEGKSAAEGKGKSEGGSEGGNQSGAKKEPPQVLIGYAHGRWVIGIGADTSRTTLRISTRKHAGEWMMDMNRDIQLIVNGRDRSREVRGSITKALAAFAAESAPGGEPAVPSPAQGKRSNATEVRKGTVIRT